MYFGGAGAVRFFGADEILDQGAHDFREQFIAGILIPGLRRRALISFNPGVQIILTATRVDSALIKNLSFKKFTVKNGAAT